MRVKPFHFGLSILFFIIALVTAIDRDPVSWWVYTLAMIALGLDSLSDSVEDS